MDSLRKRLKNAEPEAFVEIYDQLGDRLFRYVRSQIGNQQDTMDITQEIFLRLVKSHESLSRAENLTAYVFQVARTETIRWRARRKLNLSSLENLDCEESHSLNAATHDASSLESGDWINLVLARLDPLDREIVQLKVFSELTFREVAEIMNLQPSNVATRYRRALAAIEQRVAQDSISQERTP